MKYILLLCISMFVFAQDISTKTANNWATLPLKCIEQQYPNKLGQVLTSHDDLDLPQNLHPAFYGCFDWHSAVHGHWSLVYLLSNYTNLTNRDLIIKQLEKQLTKENIAQEVVYFSKKENYSFERTYGWNWLLQLQLELEQSKDSYALELAKNLKPLSDLIISRYIEFLPKLNYPLRNGTHSNTAFGLNFAWDYAVFAENTDLQNAISTAAKRLFLNDAAYPFHLEPSGTDFLSPFLEELALMNRVLNKDAFLSWGKKFAKPLFMKNFSWEVAKVSDRTDGHLVHLDGLNFSRAWNMFSLAKHYPNELRHLNTLAQTHFNAAIDQLNDGNYEGEHWLTSFALYALKQKNK